MSIWSDIQERSQGDSVRKEDEHWGIIEITKCSPSGKRFNSLNGIRIPDEKVGNLFYFTLNWRLIDSKDVDNQDKCWFRNHVNIVVSRGDKDNQKKVRDMFLGYVKEMEKEGRLDPILMSDGQYRCSEKNDNRLREMVQRIQDYNKKMVFGEGGVR